jgi:hypothetical protein
VTVKAKYHVDTGAAKYRPGDLISGLEKDEEKRLVDAGFCVYAAPVVNEETSNLPNEQTVSGPLTLEAFKDLKSDPQKEHLRGLGIEPGSNEKERLEQYLGWLAAQSDEEGNGQSDEGNGQSDQSNQNENGQNEKQDGPDAGGPNTSLEV